MQRHTQEHENLTTRKGRAQSDTCWQHWTNRQGRDWHLHPHSRATSWTVTAALWLLLDV